MTYPQVLSRSLVEPDDGTNLRCNLQREIGSEKAAKQMIWKKVGIRKSDRISNQQKAIKRRMKNSTELDLPERISQQKKAINRRMKIPTDSDFPEQSHRG